jgi:integrase
MKNSGKSDDTIRNTDKCLQVLDRHSNLNDSEQVKTYIANHNASNGYKRNLTIAYTKYANAEGIQWERPKYKEEAKRPRIPTKEKIEMIIASCGKTLATKLTLSMETGLRPVELQNLKAKDVDLEQRIVYPTTAKHGASRALRISQNLAHLLQEHIIRNDLASNDNLFKGKSTDYGEYFRKARNKLAKKLQDPTLRTIRLYDLRHYFATTTYYKTRDLLLTKTLMGHTKVETTLIYTQLLNLNDDEWTCRTAQNVQEATQLIENGFEYITEMDGLKLFRRRK